MLQDIRKSTQGTTAKVIVGLIVIAFAFWGVESILLGTGGSAVAEVNGESIEPQELQQAVSIEQRRLINSMGDNLDPAMLDEQLVSQRAMQGLIARKLLLQSAREMGLHVSDAQIGAVVASMEQFQVDGQFSEQMYRAILGESGYSPASFKQAMVDDMLVNQVRMGIAASEFATPSELGISAAIVEEQRDLRYLTIPLDRFREAGEVSDGDIEAYYQSHLEDFRSPESVEVDYIELRAEDFARPVTEEEIVAAYEQEVAQGRYQSQNRVSHILLSRLEDESDEAFQQRINEVQSAIGAGGEFAELAGTYSNDLGSAVSGGDLGFSGGDVFPEPMEEAIAGLAVGEVSGPVETDAGVHFILLAERREGEAPTLEVLRPELEQRLSLDGASAELLRSVELLKDLSFNAENLDMPAEELGLNVQQSEAIVRGQTDGLFANPALNKAAFSQEVLAGGLNSDVIELEPGHWVVLHARQHNTSEVLPLADVREQIVSSIVEGRAVAAARGAAESAVQDLREGASVEEVSQQQGYDWQVELAVSRRQSTLPSALARDAFRLKAPADNAAAVEMVAGENGDYYVYQLTRVKAGNVAELSDSDRAGLQRLVSGEFSQLVDSEYRQGLRDTAEIEVM